MKKKLIIAGMLLITRPAIAQLSISPEAGFQMTNVVMKVYDHKFDGTKMKAGFRGGVNLDLGITGHLHLQVGMFYSAAGFKMNEEGAGLVGPSTISFNYLQVPVYLNYMTGKAGGDRFFAGAGPYLGYAFKATAKADGKKSDITIGTKEGHDFLKPMDFGININAGYMLAMGAYVRVHYSLGLSDNFPAADNERSMKNNGFGLSLGYAFKL